MLTADVDARGRAQSEPIEVIVHVVNPDCLADLVEIDIAGLGDRVVQIDGAVALRLPVTIAVGRLGQHEKAAAEGLASQVGRTRFKRGQRQHGLDCRARRVTATNRAVEQRQIQVVLQFAVLAGAHADGKQVGIKRRGADQRQDLTGLRIQRDGGAPTPLQKACRQLLQIEINAQIHVRTRARFFVDRQRVQQFAGVAGHLAASCVGYQVSVTRRAVQARLETALDAGLAGVRSARVASGIQPQ